MGDETECVTEVRAGGDGDQVGARPFQLDHFLLVDEGDNPGVVLLALAVLETQVGDLDARDEAVVASGLHLVQCSAVQCGAAQGSTWCSLARILPVSVVMVTSTARSASVIRATLDSGSMATHSLVTLR